MVGDHVVDVDAVKVRVRVREGGREGGEMVVCLLLFITSAYYYYYYYYYYYSPQLSCIILFQWINTSQW